MSEPVSGMGKHHLYLLSFSIIGMALVLAREIVWGPVLSWDSVYYISKAENLLSGKGFISSLSFSTKYSLLSDPPFYPILIALASFLIFEPRDVVGPLNAVVFGLTIFVTGRWMWQRLESRFLFVWGTIAVTLAMPLTALAALVLTEASFIFFVIFSLIYIDKFLDTRNRTTLIWTAAFALIAFLTRSLGISVITLVLLLLIAQRGITLHEKFKDIIIFCAISIMPLIFLYFPSYSEQAMKIRSIDIDLYLENLGHIFAVFCRWVFLEIGNGLGASIDVRLTEIALGSIVLFLLLVAVCYGFFRKPDEQKEPQFNWKSFRIFGGFLLIYIVLLVKILPDFGQIVEHRFVAPMYLPCLLSTLLMLDRFFAIRKIDFQKSNYIWLKLKNITTYKVKFAQFVIFMGLSLWVMFHVPLQIFLIKEYNKGNGDFIAYSAPGWSNNMLLNEFRKISLDDCLIYSNNTAVVYFYANQKCKYEYMHQKLSIFFKNSIENLEDDIYIVWFSCCSWGHDYDIHDLSTLQELETVVETADGVVFRVQTVAGQRKIP